MVGLLKAWFTGLSVIGKVGTVSALVIGSGVATNVATSCDSPVVYKNETVSQTVPFQISANTVKTSTLDDGAKGVMTAGTNGSKNVSYKVSDKCNKEVGRQQTNEQITAQPSDEIDYVGTRKIVQETKPVAFGITKQNDSTMAQGQTKVLSAGTNGIETLKYQVFQDEGQPETKSLLGDTVTTKAVDEVDAIGTYVPPIQPPAPSVPTPLGCTPLTNGGNCYRAGEYCRNSDHGLTGTAGNGESIICANNNGWRWEPN